MKKKLRNTKKCSLQELRWRWKLETPSVDGVSLTNAPYHHDLIGVGWGENVVNQLDKYCITWPNSWSVDIAVITLVKRLALGPLKWEWGGWCLLKSQHDRFRFIHSCMEMQYFQKFELWSVPPLGEGQAEIFWLCCTVTPGRIVDRKICPFGGPSQGIRGPKFSHF